MIDKGKCDDGFVWNPSICEYECDKSYDVGEYSNYVNCKWRKMLIDKIIEKCDENIDGNEMIYNVTLYDCGKICKSCTLYIILLIIGIACIYFY